MEVWGPFLSNDAWSQLETTNTQAARTVCGLTRGTAVGASLAQAELITLKQAEEGAARLLEHCLT